MKNNTIPFIKILALSALLFTSTQSFAQNIKVAKSQIIAATETYSLDISSTGLNATMHVPIGVQVLKDEYSILIGNGKDIIIEIEETSEPFEAKVGFVQKNTVRGFFKFVQQDKNSFIALMNPFGSKMEYDFVYFVEINGTNYILHDRGQDFHDNAKVIEALLAMAKTIKAI
jgi:hypothetical protein